MSLVGKLADRLRGFVLSRRGNVAMIYALSLVPLSLAAGAGLDYARAIVVRNSMSSALDAAALAVGATPGLSTAQQQTLAQQYFNANYHESLDYGTPSAVTISPSGQSLVVTTSDTMPTTMLKMVGINTMTVNARSTVVWGQLKVWVSLVLDNTGSMCQSDAYPNISGPCASPNAGSKIVALKAATHNLLTMLQNASTNAGDVKVSLVPFVKDVNVGTASVNASWLDWADWNASNGTCSVSGKTDQPSCVGTTGTWSGGSCRISGISVPGTCITTHGTWTAAKCSKSQYTTQSTCQSHSGIWTAASCNISSPTYSTQSSCQAALATWSGGSCNLPGYVTVGSCLAGVGVWTPANHNTWNGCVMDRGTDSGPDTTYNYDVMKSSPVTGRPTSYFQPEQYSPCPQQSVVGLSYDWSSLSTAVDNMAADGGTNQTIGLVWGWHALTNSDPLNSGSLPAGTARYIIILSDGLNTYNRWFNTGNVDSPDIDARMNLVCSNAKADGIVVYAVFVDIGGAQGNSSVLQNCASDSSKYFDLTSAGQINAAFAAIGQQITNLHVSQ